MNRHNHLLAIGVLTNPKWMPMLVGKRVSTVVDISYGVGRELAR